MKVILLRRARDAFSSVILTEKRPAAVFCFPPVVCRPRIPINGPYNGRKSRQDRAGRANPSPATKGGGVQNTRSCRSRAAILSPFLGRSKFPLVVVFHCKSNGALSVFFRIYGRPAPRREETRRPARPGEKNGGSKRLSRRGNAQPGERLAEWIRPPPTASRRI